MKIKQGKIGIVVFAFGSPANIHSNRILASIAIRKARELQAPVYTQEDILINNSDIDVEYIKQRDASPPPTLKIAQGSIKWAKYEEINDILIIAAEPHLWRCLRDLAYARKKMKLDVNFQICEEVYNYPFASWFCSDSIQERTRSRKRWERREKVLKHLPLWIYALISK